MFFLERSTLLKLKKSLSLNDTPFTYFERHHRKRTFSLPNKTHRMDRLSRLLGQAGMGGGFGGGPPPDQNVPDTAEITHISSLALLKMLK